MNKPLLLVQHLSKSYVQGLNTIQTLQDINLSLNTSELVAITGASGSGKSTLLQLIGLLDTPNKGTIILDNQIISKLDEKRKTKIRADYLGFVYQYHYLLKDFTIIDNIVLPQLIRKKDYKASFEHAAYLLNQLGLIDRKLSFPGELSGGEQQRVAIARALANNPALLLADEPTGNLDQHNALKVFEILLKLVREKQMSAIVVTHSSTLAAKMDRVYEVHNGRLSSK